MNGYPASKNIGPSNPDWLLDESIDHDLRRQWVEHGFSIMRKVFSSDEIFSYNRTVRNLRNSIDDGKDCYGYGDRIGQLHQKFPELLELAGNDRVRKFLKWAFGDDPVLFASLNFDRGTEQEAHVDTIFFYPQPSYAMCGVWVALEDIDPDAGPLFYLDGSHKWPFYGSEDVVRMRPQLAEERISARNLEAGPEKSRVVSMLGDAWTQDFVSMERKIGAKRVTPSLKAGDLVFWHSFLAHGGSPRVDPSLSRKSAVFHFIGASSKLYTYEQFMLYDESELAGLQEQPMELGNYKDRIKYMKYPHFVYYSSEGEIIQPL